uniref:Uncharacterized protein n=1 Tax=Aegilops tauschii subsp. strangulata TaxID=200361 RepID=A0A453S926_AEGTS
SVEDVDSTLIDAGLERSTEVNRVEWPFDHKPQVFSFQLQMGLRRWRS